MSEPGNIVSHPKIAQELIATRQGALRLCVKIIALTCFCMGLGGYIGYARLGEVAGHPAFVSPYFSSVVIFCGIALCVACSGTKYARLWALAVICSVALARMAPLWSDAWVNARSISANAATVLILLGATAALMLHRAVKRRRQPWDWGVVVVALLGVSVSTLIAYALIEDNIVTRKESTRASAIEMANDIEERFGQAEALMNRLGERLNAVDHLPSQTLIEQEFGSYLRDLPFFHGFAIVDSNGLIAWERTRDGSPLEWIESLIADSKQHEWLKHVHASGQAHIALHERVSPNGKEGLVVAPLSSAATKGWLVVACFDLASMFTAATSQSEYVGDFRILQGNRVLYQTPGESSEKSFTADDITIPVHHDFEFQLSYVSAKAPANSDSEVLPEFVLLAGIIFTFFLISSQRLTHIARERAVQLSHSVLHDPLTGLPNRRMLEHVLKDACTRAKNENVPVSVVFFDLDGVKLVNDSVGHDIGDALLIEVANRLRFGAKKDVHITRLDGVEFVLLFFGIPIQQVQERTQNFIDELSRPYLVDGGVLRVTASAGIAASDGDIKDAMQLVSEADLAMLRAKQEGRNTWHTYTSDMSELVTERLALRNDLQSALDSEDLQLHYQPIIEGLSGRVVGVEALARWPHPTRGHIPPSRFIPLAEETGQIVPLTEWVLTTACRDSAILRTLGLAPFPVIVNISPLYFRRAGFVQYIQEVLQGAALPAAFLEIEITEGVLLDDEQAAILKLTQLRDMGIRTSIDDFGTGYSSLSYLKNLPIDKVKIDRSFIIDVVSDPADAAIVQGIISMAHHLGLKVVAEGVETESQFAFLNRSYCDEFQGYLFARPMPLAALAAMLSERNCRLHPSSLRDEPSSERVLLLVDDEKNILTALTRLLRRDGYRILTANGPAEAFELLAKHRVQVIVSDQRMPEMNGTEFFSKVKNMYPDTTRIILSGYTDLKSVTEAINHGAIYKFLTKPWDDDSLRKEVEHAFINQWAKDTQEILNVERERIRQLFQQAPGFICVLRGPQHIFELANDAYYQLIGHRQILGCVLAEVLPEVVEQGYLDKLDRVFASGKPFIGRALSIQLQRLVGGSLEQCYIDLFYQPIRDAGGRVSGIFVQGNDVSEAHKLAEEVSYQASHDFLTGLYNRQAFTEKSRALEEFAGPHALLYMDLDHFKIVNDRGGHAAGDALLLQVCAIFQQYVMKPDVLARLGGDEFALILRGRSEEDALEQAHAMRRKVRDIPFVWEGRRYSVTVSIGLVMVDALQSLSFAEALSLADVACLLAKEKGRNRVQLSRNSDLEIMQRQRDMDWVGTIEECIRQDRVVLYGQRFTAMQSHEHKAVECCEVLVRLLDPNGNLVLPGVFTAAAEHFGLIEELDHHIIRKAFLKLHSMPATQRDKIRYFINVSGITIGGTGFAAYVELLLADYTNVRPGHVCFEVTETAAISNLQHSVGTIRQLTEQGFSFALDDFGSRMSSFCYLQELPVQYLKIDGEFIKGMLTQPGGVAIVEAVVKVARAMNILTVAESVEFPELLPRLREMGIDYGQGSALHQPEPL